MTQIPLLESILIYIPGIKAEMWIATRRLTRVSVRQITGGFNHLLVVVLGPYLDYHRFGTARDD